MEPDKIRVVIVDDTAETRSNIRKLLAFADNIAVIGEAADGSEAVEVARDLKPDCILMDINMPGLDGISAAEQIYQAAPECLTIVISVQEEQEYLRRAMAAGARDYLTKPFSGDELINTINRVWQLECARRSRHEIVEKPTRSAETIAVFSAKGGVGKTTIAVNLAAALAKQNHEVILVDFDLQFGDVPLMLDLAVQHSISDWFADGCPAAVDYLLEAGPGLRILAAPEVPEEGELITAEHIAQILKELKSLADFIVIDTPQFFQETTLQALETADHILLAGTPDLANLKNIRRCLDVLAKLNLAAKVKVTANKVGAEGIRPEQFSSHLNYPVWRALPYDPRLAYQACVQGIPIVDLNPRSKLGRALEQMSKDILGIYEPKKMLPFAGTLFTRKG